MQLWILAYKLLLRLKYCGDHIFQDANSCYISCDVSLSHAKNPMKKTPICSAIKISLTGTVT